jgi:hypothetical protein
MTMPRGGSAEVAHVGQVIEDGDGGRMVIRTTAEQTAGALYEFDWFIHHILRPGDHLVVPPGAYHTFGNPSAEVGHAIAAFRPAMNIHQFFVELFEVFRASRGLKRQVGVSKVLRRYPEYIKFRKPVQLLIAVLAWLPMVSKRRTDLPPS